MYAVTLSIHLTHDEREESNIVIEDTESILRRQREGEREIWGNKERKLHYVYSVNVIVCIHDITKSRSW